MVGAGLAPALGAVWGGSGPYVRTYGALAHCSNALRISGTSSSLVDQLTKAARMAGFPAKKVGVSSTRPSFLISISDEKPIL
jgi:hypothetical protein